MKVNWPHRHVLFKMKTVFYPTISVLFKMKTVFYPTITDVLFMLILIDVGLL